MKILIISDVLLRNDNGVGNSCNNIFSGMPNVTIANICCQEGVSDNSISSACFQLSENRLIKNLINPNVRSGIVEQKHCTESRDSIEPQKISPIFKWIKRSRWQIFFAIRNGIWKVGRWKSNELNRFIDEFNPDLIFAQLQDKLYLNNIIMYVANYTKVPLTLYVWDDVYSLKQYSISPLFWIDRLLQRNSIRRLVKQCDILFTICKEQMLEYSKTLNVRTELLYKGHKFEDEPGRKEFHRPLQLLYTGNLYSGRYKTLWMLCESLERYNRVHGNIYAQLKIYSGTNLTDKEIQKLNLGESSAFMGKVSEAEVKQLQKDADLLIHIEPMDLKGSLLCRLSFSTKLVDYFYNRKCIFAVGQKRCASIKYLHRYDAAVVVTKTDEIERKLWELLDNQDLMESYAHKSWNCGRRNHNISNIQEKLINFFTEIMK